MLDELQIGYGSNKEEGVDDDDDDDEGNEDHDVDDAMTCLPSDVLLCGIGDLPSTRWRRPRKPLEW